jgi:hypothetical protein
MNEYESRQEERRQRYLALADKHDKLASAAHTSTTSWRRPHTSGPTTP